MLVEIGITKLEQGLGDWKSASFLMQLIGRSTVKFTTNERRYANF